MEFETSAFPHIIGALYGQALGNAWAMPAYFRPEQTWEHFGGWVDEFHPAPTDHPLHAGLQAGQVTADTHLAIALAKTLITDGQITPQGSVQTMINWYDQLDGDNSLLIGPNTQRIVASLKNNTQPEFISLCNSHVGAMGINPIGLINSNNPDAAIQDAITFCTATHMTNVATSGACAVAAAIAKAVSSNTTLEEIIAVAMHGANIGFGHGHPGLGASVGRKIDLAVTWAMDRSVDEHDRLQNLHDLIGVTAAAADVVPCAFGILAMVDGNPVETAVYATALSGKADTVGAIAGAIAGAWHTIDAIPLENIEALQQANSQLNIEETAEGLYEIAKKNYHENKPEPDEPLTSSFLDELA
jgi:ADP-ribosylglycohydrolase